MNRTTRPTAPANRAERRRPERARALGFSGMVAQMPSRLLVMSMHRYLAGVRPERADPLHADLLDESRARVAAIRAALEADIGSPAGWDDERDEMEAFAYTPHDLHAVRSLVAHHEHPPRRLLRRPSFRLLADPREHPSLRKIFSGAPTQFPHMMRHSDDRGFFLPVAFAAPSRCHEPEWWNLGSSDGLRAELTRAEPLVEDQKETLGEMFSRLREAVERSCVLQLPLILEG